MNWSRTKSIFIVTFLMLNVFLGWQFVDKIREGQLQSIEQAQGIMERLEVNNITLPDQEVNTTGARGVVLEGGLSLFTEEELEVLPNQEFEISPSGTTIQSVFDEPINVDEALEEANDQSFAMFLSQNVLNGQDYVFLEREDNYLYFNQVYEQIETSVNEQEPLIIQLNDEDEIIGYQQRHFAYEPNPEEREIVSYMTAVEVLLDNHYISTNNDVINIEFGYYSLADQTPRFFSPMWAVTVDRTTDFAEEEDIRIYLVNAILMEQHQWYPDESSIEEELEEEEPGIESATPEEEFDLQIDE
ncbi:regulatory protein YycI of two-component signal transduction system YycFG [Alkalihalobacillus xiaoxiensis]|uniref:Regulatory protein YycI of two-component signal transduction system YycFG n=1 Tax=Shouchella xiaoxiensis TaxID=766895 RepID=A0ABS2T137_9BACI|nr:two-component system regulatory protein YycI [Shouchella xiaoxiensis]MBM7840956.1 regulatory protein YycI of two-component signal transduction system YycFG [Shouchella xiaoxiensis]